MITLVIYTHTLLSGWIKSNTTFPHSSALANASLPNPISFSRQVPAIVTFEAKTSLPNLPILLYQTFRVKLVE